MEVRDVITNAENPSAFISYSHDTNELRKKALDFTQALRDQGIDCDIDQFHEVTPPPEGWTRWMEAKVRMSNHVLVVCSEGYYDKATMSVRSGRGVKWESKLIYNEMYQNDSLNGKFIPVSFGPWTLDQVPPALQDTTIFNIEDQKHFQRLIQRLHSHEPVRPRPLGQRPNFSEERLGPIELLYEKNYIGRVRGLAESKSELLGITITELFEDLFKTIQGIKMTEDDGTTKGKYDSVMKHIEDIFPATKILEPVFDSLARHSSVDGLQAAYEGFGRLRPLYEYFGHPGLSQFRSHEFEGFQFCGYFWAVCMFASLVKYERWQLISPLLTQDIFVEHPHSARFLPFRLMNSYCIILENAFPGKTGIIAMDKAITLNHLSTDDFRSGDLFLYLYTNFHNIHTEKDRIDVWRPYTSVSLQSLPRFLAKGQSLTYLDSLAVAFRFKNGDELRTAISNAPHVTDRVIGNWNLNDVLSFLDMKLLGRAV